jgi:hypothetical protein
MIIVLYQKNNAIPSNLLVFSAFLNSCYMLIRSSFVKVLDLCNLGNLRINQEFIFGIVSRKTDPQITQITKMKQIRRLRRKNER